jgi:TP901 family phage tail tape measure protein
VSSKLTTSLLLRFIDAASGPMGTTLRTAANGFATLKTAAAAADKHFDTASHLKHAADGAAQFAQGAATFVERPIKTAADFEHAMNRVGTKLEASAADVATLTTAAKEMGSTTRYSSGEAATGMEMLAQAGYSTTQILSALPAVLDLAANDDMQLGPAALIASTSLHSFGMEAKEMTRLVDVLAKTSTATDTTVTDLGESLKYAAPSAHLLGLNVERTSAMLGVLANNGLRGTVAGTALKDVFSRLAAPKSIGRQLLDHYGIKPEDAKHNLRPVETVLAELDAKMAKLGTARRSLVLDRVFGQEGAGAAAILMHSAASGELASSNADLMNAQGYAASQAARMMNDTEGATKRLTSATERLNISVGDSLLPQTKELEERVAKYINTATGWIEKHQGVAQGSLVLVGGLGLLAAGAAGTALALSTLSTSLGVLAVAVGSKSTGVQILGAGLRWLGATALSVVPGLGAATEAVWAFGASMLASPLAPFVIGAAALGGAAYLIWRNWDGLSAFFHDWWQGFEQDWNTGVSGFVDSWLEGFKQIRAGAESLWHGTGPAAGTGSGAEASGPPALGPNSSSSSSSQSQMSGELHVKIDSEGRPRVVTMRSGKKLRLSTDTSFSLAGS